MVLNSSLGMQQSPRAMIPASRFAVRMLDAPSRATHNFSGPNASRTPRRVVGKSAVGQSETAIEAWRHNERPQIPTALTSSTEGLRWSRSLVLALIDKLHVDTETQNEHPRPTRSFSCSVRANPCDCVDFVVTAGGLTIFSTANLARACLTPMWPKVYLLHLPSRSDQAKPQNGNGCGRVTRNADSK